MANLHPSRLYFKNIRIRKAKKKSLQMKFSCKCQNIWKSDSWKCARDGYKLYGVKKKKNTSFEKVKEKNPSGNKLNENIIATCILL